MRLAAIDLVADDSVGSRGIPTKRNRKYHILKIRLYFLHQLLNNWSAGMLPEALKYFVEPVTSRIHIDLHPVVR